MTPQRLVAFANDIARYGPLASLALATAVCLPSLGEFVAGHLASRSALERYALALVLSFLAVRGLSRLVITYARRNLAAETELVGDPNAARHEPA